MIEDRAVTLVASTVVGYETSLHPDSMVRTWVMRCVAPAQENRFVDSSIRERAQVLEQEGFKALDALHVACAEMAHCDYFITCDDRLIKHYRHLEGILYVCTPTEFIEVEFGGER